MIEETESNISIARRFAQIIQENRLAKLNRFCSCGRKIVWLQCPIQCEYDAWEEGEPREPVYFDGLPHNKLGLLYD